MAAKIGPGMDLNANWSSLKLFHQINTTLSL